MKVRKKYAEHQKHAKGTQTVRRKYAESPQKVRRKYAKSTQKVRKVCQRDRFSPNTSTNYDFML